MKLRKYEPNDCSELAELFYNTVHIINATDYSKTQLNAWAIGTINMSDWDKSFSVHNTVVAEIEDIIVGFGDMDDSGYLDRLYVHSNYQRKGIATAILNELEQQAFVDGISHFTTHASITAIPFFKQQGYQIVRENKVVRSGVELTNFIMEKIIVKVSLFI